MIRIITSILLMLLMVGGVAGQDKTEEVAPKLPPFDDAKIMPAPFPILSQR